MSRFPNWRESPRDALPQFAITARGVAKRYRGVDGSPPVQALSDVDLAVPRGEIFGLLGPNGAGKSTFINILAGLVRKSAGGVEIWGHDIDADPRLARASIGIVPQELNMDPFFTARELLDVQAGYYGVPRARRRTQELLSIMGLTSKANTRGRDLSGGQKRRLMMAKA
ncbi:MAG: ABC transporter ATP-binding protein, partial [Alphaproteobacteria bacterium]